MLQRLISTYNPLFYLLLLLIAVGLRWPLFASDFIGQQEALLLAAGNRIAAGHPIYADTWIDQPPLLPWLYALFSALFGGGALLAARVFACCIALTVALLLQQLFSLFRFSSPGTGWVALACVVAFSVPWYQLELSREWLLTLPMLLVVRRLLLDYESNANAWTNHAAVGILCAVCIAIDYRAVLWLPAVLLTHTVLRPVRLSDWTTLLIALLSTVAALIGVLAFQGAMADAWEISIYGITDRVALALGERPVQNAGDALSQALLVWGLLALMAFLGAVQLRARFYSLPIRQRKAYAALLIWLVAAGVIVLSSVYDWQLRQFVILLPPLSFLAGYWITTQLADRRAALALALLLLPVLHSLSLYAWLDYEGGPRWLARTVDPLRQAGELRRAVYGPPELAALRQLSQTLDPNATLWVLTDDYDLYWRLERPCGSAYLDMLAVRRMLQPDRYGWAWGAESLPETYDRMALEAPGWVLARDGLFQRLRQRMPLLLQQYQAAGDCGGYRCQVLADLRLAGAKTGVVAGSK